MSNGLSQEAALVGKITEYQSSVKCLVGTEKEPINFNLLTPGVYVFQGYLSVTAAGKTTTNTKACPKELLLVREFLLNSDDQGDGRFFEAYVKVGYLFHTDFGESIFSNNIGTGVLACELVPSSYKFIGEWPEDEKKAMIGEIESGQTFEVVWIDNWLEDALDDYVTRDYVDSAINVAVTDMATQTYVDNAIGSAVIDMATQTYVDSAIGSAIDGIASDMATQTYVNETIDTKLGVMRMALTNKLTAIADSIRGKLGTTDAMTLDEMPNKISSIETSPSIQESKTVDITSNGITEVIPDDGYGGIKKVDVSVAVPESPAPEPLAHDKTVTITTNGTTEVTPDDGYGFLTRVTINTNVPIPTAPKITITELSTTETVVALSYGGLVLAELSKHGGDATKQLMENAFEKIIFSVDVDGLAPNIPVGYNLDEAATLLLNMDKLSAPIGAIFRGAPGQILVNFNESGSIAIDITPEVITTITQQTIAYIRTALGSDTIGVTCHDYIHANMMDLWD